MAERPRELDQRFQMVGGSIWGYYRLRSYFSRHCDTTQYTLTHHTENKPFLLLGLAAEYKSRRRRPWCANNIAADHQMFITLTGQLSWQRLRRSAVDLHSKPKKNRSLSHLLGHLGVTYALHLWLVGKPVIDFIFVVIERFSLSLTVETLWAEIGRSRRFSKGVGHFERRFKREGPSPTNHSWYQSSSVIILSCGIKISAVRHLVFSQCTRVALYIFVVGRDRLQIW